MTPSLRSPSLTRSGRHLSGWRRGLVASTLSAALVLSPLALQAAAEDQAPEDPTSATPSSDPQPSPTPSEVPAEEPSDEPTDEATDDSAESTSTESTSTPDAEPSSPDPTADPAADETAEETADEPSGEESSGHVTRGPTGPMAASGGVQSLYASGGSGAYRGSIDWFEWGNHGDVIPAGGLTKTTSRTVAGGTLATTCTISNLVGFLSAYRPGSWSGDGLDDLYNVGGTGTSNQLIIGLRTANGGAPTFHLDCSVTLDGNPVPLAGLVMADAEQSGSTEYVQATIPAGGEWRLIDRIRTAGCSSDTTVTRTGQTLRMTGPATVCATGPDGVAFMEGATSADVELRGSGVSAIALGVMLFNDFGDAPASYGDAAALYSPNFTGGTVPAGTSSLFGATLNTPTQPATRLGATVDSESSQQISTDATGDGTDEDAVGALGTVTAVPGATYTLPAVACTGPGSVAGWIDWNRNGSFETGERSTTATCSGSSVSLAWIVPADARSGASFLRLRIGPTAAALTGPTGVTTAGEVEDHPLALVAPADLGDAPASYGTTVDGNGPRHDVPGYDAVTHTAPLMLGANIDTDADGAPGAPATGDDSAGVDDEDALPSLVVASNGTTASATVPVVNSTGSAATLYGWLDTDLDGAFQAGEAATVAVPDGATSVTLSWSGLPPAVDGSRPVVRLRLTSATLTDTAGTATLDERSQGAAPDGEVEDSLATVTTVVSGNCTDQFVETFGAGAGRAALPAGQTTYLYAATGTVNDGEYALVPGIDTSYGSWWHTGPDHTPGDTDGRAMLVNAAFASGTFFSKTFSGLQVGRTYDFSAWITNANGAGSPMLPDVSFRVVDPGSGSTLATVSTGSLPNQAGLVWDRYHLSFAATQSSVRLELVNNGPGGNGNDLALDDVAIGPVCEYGDAPDSYGTLRTSGGPVHEISDGLRLGATLDLEGEGMPGPAADGDDTDNTDDEDGITAPLTVTSGEVPSVDVTVTNSTATAGTLAGWIDLDKSGTFDANERATALVPPLTSDATVTLTFTSPVTTSEGTYARFRLYPGTVTDPRPLGAADGGEVEDHPVTTLVPALSVAKSSDATPSSKPGEIVRYTVTLSNTGTGDFTVANPARLVDDLTGVLDDATYQGDASATVDGGAVVPPTYVAPRISWSGPLAAGKSLVMTYSVVLQGGGDGQVLNTAFAPPTPVPGPTPDCSAPGNTVPCDTESFDLPKLTLAKSADRSNLPATGETITYTVVVHNPGPGDYTTGHLATFSDDLSDVMDDAEPGTITATTGDASINGSTLSWSGVLDANQSARITYTFTYRATGDRVLDNTACVPAAEAQVPAQNCDSVSVSGARLVHAKSVDPASGTTVEVGDVLTYTLTFDNTAGEAAATVDTEDDLSDVVDDAALDTASITAGPGLTAIPTPAGTPTAIEVTGLVPAGATRTVTYQVTVRPFAQQGDHVIANALACEPGEPTPCAPETTRNPVRHVVLTKVKTSPTSPDTGDRVTYTLTVHNDGTGDWTEGDPVSVVDDLTGVLDDATWDGTATAPAGTLSFARPELTWTGALAHGATVTITYSVTVTNLGDHRLVNTASVTSCALPECTPPPVVVPLPHVVPAKTSTPAPGRPVQPGDLVTYTLSWTNDGDAPGVVDSTDDLRGVLDDATMVTEPTSSDPAVTATRTGASLRVVGPIDDGDTVTVTYQVRVKPVGQHGDNTMANVLTPDTPQVTCPPFPCTPVVPPGTQHPVGDLEDWKTVDPATGSTVRAGTRLTYTLHFRSSGTASVDVDRVDDLGGVLDDATLVGGPTSSSPALTVSGPASGRIAVTGTLAPGEAATVSYTVEVKPDAKRGDDRLGNFLLEPGQQPPASCTGTDAKRLDCTLNHVSDVEVSKASAPASGVEVEVGDTVGYTLTFRNVGKNADAAPSAVDQVDHLDDVLDDASWTSGPTVSSSSLTATRDGDRLRVSGSLAPGQVVTVKYKVTVEGKGNDKMRNVVVPAGDDPVCAAGSPNCTTHAISSGSDSGGHDGGADGPDGDLPDTGATVAWWTPMLGVLAVLAGLWLLLLQRHRRHES